VILLNRIKCSITINDYCYFNATPKMLLNKPLYDKFFSHYWIDSIGQQKISFSNLSSVDSYIYLRSELIRTIYLGDLINENVDKGYSKYLSRILEPIHGVQIGNIKGVSE
jgi:hypothetical protein